jgi:type VI secretion system Hcp family effector
MFAPAYMKLGDIKGEATDTAKGDHKNEIEILSFSFGEAQSTARDVASGQATGKRDAASGLPTGKRQHKPVTITKLIDKASPVLARTMASGGTIQMLEVSDGTTVHKLHNCVITSISPAGGGNRPLESISLNYEKIESVPAPKAKAGAVKEKAEKPARTSG